MASISASELLVGVLNARSEEHRARRERYVEALLAAIPVIPFDLETARIHAHLVVDLLGRGLSVGANDVLIAATALSGGHVVVTRNKRHFDRIPGLAVHEPDWA